MEHCARKFLRAMMALVAIVALTFTFIVVGCNKEPQSVVSPSKPSVVETPMGAASANGSTVVQGGLPIERLREIQNRNEDRILQLSGVRGIGIGIDGEQLVFQCSSTRMLEGGSQSPQL